MSMSNRSSTLLAAAAFFCSSILSELRVSPYSLQYISRSQSLRSSLSCLRLLTSICLSSCLRRLFSCRSLTSCLSRLYSCSSLSSCLSRLSSCRSLSSCLSRLSSCRSLSSRLSRLSSSVALLFSPPTCRLSQLPYYSPSPFQLL